MIDLLKQNIKHNIYKSLIPVESYLSKKKELIYSPTFIVGAPRTGSTLLMQLITSAIPTSYFTNMTTSTCQSLGFPLPYITGFIAKIFNHVNQRHTFKSYEGNMKGRFSPTEGTDIWSFLFGNRRSPVEPNELTSEQKNKIYQAVALTENAFKLPFINKHINLCLRIPALHDIFNTAKFIVIKRDPVDIAQSLYIIRAKKRGNEYFGPKPRECEGKEHLDLIEQVCEQVFYIEKQVSLDRSCINKSKFLDIHYKDICNDAHRELDNIKSFMDVSINNSYLRKIPKKFQFSTGSKIPNNEYDRMCNKINSLYMM
ncbi:MAG: sulfotransferase [Thermodesulfobacteriota bacterium]